MSGRSQWLRTSLILEVNVARSFASIAASASIRRISVPLATGMSDPRSGYFVCLTCAVTPSAPFSELHTPVGMTVVLNGSDSSSKVPQISYGTLGSGPAARL